MDGTGQAMLTHLTRHDTTNNLMQASTSDQSDSQLADQKESLISLLLLSSLSPPSPLLSPMTGSGRRSGGLETDCVCAFIRLSLIAPWRGDDDRDTSPAVTEILAAAAAAAAVAVAKEPVAAEPAEQVAPVALGSPCIN